MNMTVCRDKEWIRMRWENQPAVQTRNYYFNGGGTVVEHVKTAKYSRASVVTNTLFTMDFQKIEGVSYEELPPVVRRCYERQFANT